MIYTFQINTTDIDRLKYDIQNYLKQNNAYLSPEHIKNLAHYIHSKSYMYVDEVQASSEDSAFEKCDDTRVIEELEITDVDYSDEEEAEERARARYESIQEDIAMEEYYERKYGNEN